MIPIDRVDKSDIVRTIDWNSPGIKGYTFHGKGATLIDVFPHHPGQKFPYDERVAELWVRDAVTANSPFSNCYEDSSERSLIIRTNKGRSLVLGPHLRTPTDRQRGKIEYKAIAKLPQTDSSRAYLVSASTRFFQTWVAFEEVSVWKNRKVVLPSPQALPGHALEAEYLQTSVQLEGVIEVSLCQKSSSVVTGLLLTYSDGSRRSVGQVRVDLLRPSIKVTGNMWLVFDREGMERFNWLLQFQNTVAGASWVGFSTPVQISSRDSVEDDMSEVLASEAEAGVKKISECPAEVVTEIFGEDMGESFVRN
ncbi:uncharacterized protein FTOL_00388 [Fusarium torulosum]|uniref:Uncharacterized protein n=1 Tax=Fusarium torulosum TaxID=33205 RepID=A0AAE8LY68_9HYPO|nr:uncharacterized protein FTOL_00388 [Fusarium torulosum]